MVNNNIFNSVTKRLEFYLIKKNNFKLTGQNYDLILFIPLNSVYDSSKYSLIISSKLLNKLNQKTMIEELLFDLSKNLSREEYLSINRINIIHSNSSFVKNMNFTISQRERLFKLNDFSIGEENISTAYLIKSLVLDKLIQGNTVTMEVLPDKKNPYIFEPSRINAGIKRIDKNFNVIYYTVRGLKTIFPRDRNSDKFSEQLKKESEKYLISEGYLSHISLQKISKIL